MTRFTDGRPSRRDALRAGAATLAAGVAGLAGCSGLPPLGSRVRYGTVPAPDARTPTYRQWLPEPDAFPESADADDGYDVHSYEPPADDAPAWARGSVARSLVVYHSDYVGVHVDDVDVAIGISSIFETGSAAVLAGAVDPAVVRETAAATTYEAAGTENGFDVYTRSNRDRVLGVSTAGLVFGNGPNARDIVAIVTAAQRGDGQRYHESSADFDALSASAGQRRWTWLMPGTIRSGDQQATDTAYWDTVGRAFAFSHDDESAYSVRTWLFPEGYEPTGGEVTTALERRARADEADAVEVSIDGRVATMELARPMAQFREESANTLVAPHVTWQTTYDPAAETVQFEHVVGDSVDTDRLVVALGEGDPITEFGVGDSLDPGESLTVSTAGVESGTAVRLVYESADGNSTVTLARRELP